MGEPADLPARRAGRGAVTPPGDAGERPPPRTTRPRQGAEPAAAGDLGHVAEVVTRPAASAPLCPIGQPQPARLRRGHHGTISRGAWRVAMRGRKGFADDALVQGLERSPISPSQDRVPGLQRLEGAAAAHRPAGLPAAAVFALQRSAGNAAAAAALQVQRMGCEASCRCGGSADGPGHDDEGDNGGSTADGTGPVVQRDLWILDALKRALRDRSSLPDAGRCVPAGPETPPWLPSSPRRLPIKLGKGTRRHPKLKAPDGPGGARCRGACGRGCPDTCKSIGTYRERYLLVT